MKPRVHGSNRNTDCPGVHARASSPSAKYHFAQTKN